MSSKLGFRTRLSPTFLCSRVYRRAVSSTTLVSVVLIDDVEVMALREVVVAVPYPLSPGLKLISRYMKEIEINTKVAITKSFWRTTISEYPLHYLYGIRL
jgi:hypothetical protein